MRVQQVSGGGSVTATLYCEPFDYVAGLEQTTAAIGLHHRSESSIVRLAMSSAITISSELFSGKDIERCLRLHLHHIFVCIWQQILLPIK